MQNKCVRDGVMCGHRRRTSGHGAIGENSSLTMCHYLLDTGEKRSCPAGRRCKHFTTEKCQMIKESFYENCY